MTVDEMVGWHHRCDGHEFEQAVGDGQGSLECCSPRGRKESDTTERLNNNCFLVLVAFLFLVFGFFFSFRFTEKSGTISLVTVPVQF